MPAQLAIAFDAHRARMARVTIMCVVAVAALFALAMWVRHWGTWTLFGVIAFLQAPGALVLLYVDKSIRRMRARLTADIRELAWLHTAPEPRTKLHRIELHDRHGDLAILFVLPAITPPVIEAVRPFARVTTTDADRAAEEPLQRLLGKIAKLEAEAEAATGPRLRELRGAVTELVSAWSARVERDPSPAIASKLEAHIDRLLVLYDASKSGEPHRQEMKAIADEKGFGEALTKAVAPEHFAGEIAALLVEATALSRGESAPAEP
jgi:hypothetical protein